MSFRGGGNRGQARVLLPFGLDYADVVTTENTTEKPQYILPVNNKPSEIETLAAKQSINFQKLVSNGAFYTGKLDQNQKRRKGEDQEDETQQKTTNKQILNNINEDGIERYSDRYKKVQKIGKTIQEHPYQLQFFPEELYSVMGISNKNKKKYLSSKFAANGGIEEFLSEEKLANMDAEAKAKSIREEMMNKISNEDDNKKDDADEVPSDQEEDMDDEFDDDEDDDYNAEQYFDGGDDDEGNDDGDDHEAAF
ncbi:RPC31 [Candida pseudojiufengensis]|uniref:RPC31 n=1 Tax=Candida pseudojiufengensis TaxID=497109 RepID=UPI00222439DA|nr:RPC31 [Candida pseudojiufengensis]KAI5966722.1 RPC31 [Candida pseudojiufengensis]